MKHITVGYWVNGNVVTIRPHSGNGSSTRHQCEPQVLLDESTHLTQSFSQFARLSSHGYRRLVGYLTTLSPARLFSIECINDRWIMIWKGSERKQSWPNRGNIRTFAWRDWRKPRITIIRIADVLAEIRGNLSTRINGVTSQKTGIFINKDVQKHWLTRLLINTL
jgi:hypothetical protein